MKTEHIFFFLILLLGVLLSFGGFLQWYSAAFLQIIFFVFCALAGSLTLGGYIRLSSRKNLILLTTCLGFIWSLHFLQVLVPETGFDALWYHLPVAEAFVKAGRFTFLPDLYQSVNPLFADTYFYAGYSVFQETGAKIVAYCFGLLLAFATYCLSKNFFSDKTSLKITILVSLFQVVAWQSSSFYVDVTKAFFELVSLIYLAELLETKFHAISTRQLYLFSIGIAFGAILGSKLFSLLLIPFIIYSIFVILRKHKSLDSALLLIPGMILPFLFFIFAQQSTGNPFYSIFHHIEKLDQIGSNASLRIYIFDRLLSIPLSVFELLRARDYVYPLLAVSPLLIVFHLQDVLSSQVKKALILFTASQWLVWWFVPPLSTRYAISGFIILLILTGIVVQKNRYYYSKLRTVFGSVLFWISVLVLLIPRIYVAKRSAEYLFFMQTTEEYLEQFYDGSIDQKITDWYAQ